MSSLLPNGKQRFVDDNGRPLVGGTVTYYIPNTSALKNTWQDEAKTILNNNPIVLDSRGECTAWGSGRYRQVLKDWTGNLIWDKVVTDITEQIDTSVTGIYETLAGDGGSSLIGFLQAGDGAVGRTAEEKMRDIVSVKDFGAKGDYITDDTLAIETAMLACSKDGRTLYFPSGVYRVTKSLIKPANVKLLGSGKPNFNLTVYTDDKRFLRPGFKHKLPGSTIIWGGTQTATLTTTRTDMWSEFGYMLATEFFEPSQIEALGLVCDVDCFDADGNLTTPTTDNRAQYDTGLVVNNSMDSKFHQVSIFGYFAKKKGVVVACRDLSVSNPDYNGFFDCTIFAGAALIGYQDVPQTAGLSGTHFIGSTLYDQTYHNRAATPPDDWVNQSALFIDGRVSSTSSISGHKVIGGCMRATCPDPINIDRSLDLSLIGVTTEFTLNGAYVGQTLKYIKGTANTQRIVMSGCRALGITWGIRLRELAQEISGPLVVDENANGVALFYKNGNGIVYGPADELSGDPVVQLARGDTSSVARGWNIRYPSSGALQFNYNGVSRMSLSDAEPVTVIQGIKARQNFSTAAAPAVILAGSQSTPSGLYQSGPTTLGVSVQGASGTIWGTNTFRPDSDNTSVLGTASFRWTQLYAVSGTINTSDKNLKTVRSEPVPAEIRAWSRVRAKVFQWKDSIEKKGGDARMHFGYLAQDVEEAFEAEGLDAKEYGIFCMDEVRTPVVRYRTVEREKTDRRLVEEPHVVIEGDRAVTRLVQVERDVTVTQDFPIYDEYGNPVLDNEGNQKLYPASVMETVTEEYESSEPSGQYRRGLRMDQCAVLEGAYIRHLLSAIVEKFMEPTPKYNPDNSSNTTQGLGPKDGGINIGKYLL
jgi:hypothetical protein